MSPDEAPVLLTLEGAAGGTSGPASIGISVGREGADGGW